MKKIILSFALVLLSCNTSVKKSQQLTKTLNPCDCYKYTKILLKHQTKYKDVIMPPLKEFKQHARKDGNSCIINSTFKGITILNDTTKSINYNTTIYSNEYGKEFAKIYLK